MECGLCFAVTIGNSEISDQLLKWAQFILKHINVTLNTPLMVCQNCCARLRAVQEFCEFVERRQIAHQEACQPKDALTTIHSWNELNCPSIKMEFDGEINRRTTVEFQEKIILGEDPTDQLNPENIKMEFVCENEELILEDASKSNNVYKNLPTYSNTSNDHTSRNNENKCKHCAQVFHYERELSRHIREEHIAPQHKNGFDVAINDRTCIICNKMYQSDKALRVHIYKEHRNEKPHACKECNSKFKYHNALSRHITQAHSKPQFKGHNVKDRQCNICHKSFKTLTAQRNHMKKFHKGRGPFVCDQCPLKFSLRASLRWHKKECSGNVLKQKSKHSNKPAQIDFTTENDNSTDDQANAFEDCSVEITNRTADVEENNTEVLNQIIEGDIKTEKDTNFNENTSSQLNSNSEKSIMKPDSEILIAKLNDLLVLKTMSETGIFNDDSIEDSLLLLHFKIKKRPIDKGDLFCIICEKIFKSIGGLQGHMYRKHSNKDRFYCKKCAKTFPSIKNFTDHKCAQKNFNKNRNLTIDDPDRLCVICAKTFKNLNGLRDHMYTKHKNEKPHACSRCNLTFRFHDKLRKHLTEVHPKSAEDDTEDRTCILCNITYKTVLILRKHMYYRHKQHKPYNCKICDRSYRTNAALRRHVHSCQILKKVK